MVGREVKIGDKVGSLIAIGDQFLRRISNVSRYWVNVKCSCGVSFLIIASRFRYHRKVSCNVCSMKRRELNKVPKSQIEQLYNQKIIIPSKERNLPYNLSILEFEKLIRGKCYYCGDNPLPNVKFKKRKYVNTKVFETNSIDRLDSLKGYLSSNCVSSCIKCNRMKMDMSLIDFLSKVLKIYNYQKLNLNADLVY